MSQQVSHFLSLQVHFLVQKTPKTPLGPFLVLQDPMSLRLSHWMAQCPFANLARSSSALKGLGQYCQYLQDRKVHLQACQQVWVHQGRCGQTSVRRALVH